MLKQQSNSMMSLSTRSVALKVGIDVPSEFICPLTADVMSYPLMTRSGLNFERTAIMEWLQNGTGKCPVNGTTMTLSDLIPNRSLEEKIAHWRFENMLPDPTPSSADDIVFGITSPKKNIEKIFLRRIVQKFTTPSRSTTVSRAA